MKTKFLPIVLLAVLTTGCQSLQSIPLFNPHARLLNQLASAEDLEIQINDTLADLRHRGLLDQSTIDKAFTPSLNKAEKITKSLQVVARSTTQPTTQPIGTLDEAKTILQSVLTTLEQIKG